MKPAVRQVDERISPRPGVTGLLAAIPHLMIDPVNPSATEALGALRMQLSAGVGLGKSLRTAAPICRAGACRRCFVEAADKVDRGASFDDAMFAMSPVLMFPERAILSAGWTAGRIDPALAAVIERRKVMYQTRREFRARMTLPMMQLFLAGFIIHAPKVILGDITLGGYLVRALMPFGLVVGIFMAVRMMQITAARRHAGHEMAAPPPPTTIFDRVLLSLPIFALVQRWRNRSEFAATMSTLLGAGLGMLSALDVCARSLPNGVYRQHILKARNRIEKEGCGLHEALPRGVFWPDTWLASLEAAYYAGEEEKVLGKLGEDGRERYLSAVKVAGFWVAFLVFMGIVGYLAMLVVLQWMEVMRSSGLV